jgi:uncharacterized membrane protein
MGQSANMQFLYSFPLWIAAIGLAAAAIVISIAYRRTDKPLNRRIRVILIILRSAAIGLLLFCLLEPTLIAKEEIQRKANLMLLLDDSKSMSLTDADSNISRMEVVKQDLIQQEDGIIQEFSDKFNLHLYQFSSDCMGVKKLSPTGEGTLTDIGKAISKVSDEWRGQFTAGMVLITDGGVNSGENPLEVAGRLNIPIYTVGVGSTKMPRDIQVSGLEVSPIAYVDHLLPIKAFIRSSGYDGLEVPVSLMQGGELKDSVTLTLDDDSEQMVELQVTPQQEGTFNFSVRIPADYDELTDQNNVYPFFVKVVKTKLEILYIDGRPRWEYKFLKHSLEGDPNVESRCMIAVKQLQQNLPDQSDFATSSQLPMNRRELFSYDIVILGDVNPAVFTQPQLSMLNEFVENRGGALIFLGGQQSLGRNGFGESVLSGILPIDIGPGGARTLTGAFSPMLTQNGERHPVTRLSDDPVENKTIWREFPALTRFYMGNGIKIGATVLAEHQRAEGQPVIVFQRYGEGMVMLIASDSLWRWAFGAYPFDGDNSYYNKFWSGTLRWLASTRTKAELLSVKTDKDSYHRDEKVIITAYVYDEGYAPLNDAQLRGQIQLSTDTSPDLRFSASGNGRYLAEFNPLREGNYKVNIEAYYVGNLLGKSSTEFIVKNTMLEFQNTTLDESLLKSIADVSGGAYYHLKDISRLPDSIQDKKEIYALTRERGLWDNGILLIMVVALLTTEWFLRKKKGLV